MTTLYSRYKENQASPKVQYLLFEGELDILKPYSFLTMIARLLLLFLGVFSFLGVTNADTTITSDLDIRNGGISSTNASNSLLDSFVSPISNFFYSPSLSGEDGILNAFITIAFQIKNVMIVLAVVFLIIAVLKLIYSPNSDEDMKKWRGSIIWVTVGIFILQIVFSVWNTLLIRNTTDGIDGRMAWAIWLNIFSPIVSILQMLASFAFLAMVIYSFFKLVGSAGNEEKAKKGKRAILYGLLGFFLIRFPQTIVDLLYGSPNCKEESIITIGSCEIGDQDLTGAIALVGKIITYINGFLALICVLLVIYAGWLILISGGDDENIKKARKTVLYAFIGFVILIASHVIFRFFILQS